jgi:hypothetical protein
MRVQSPCLKIVSFGWTPPPEPEKVPNYYVWRSYDGTGNNLQNPNWGAAGQALLRQAASDYADGSSSLAVRAPNNPNPRSVSNGVCKETVETPNSMGLSNMTWAWGQFLDHEIDITPTNSAEPANIVTPNDPGDPQANKTILFDRSAAVPNSNPREQPNDISSYIDGTNVYGYNTSRAAALRRMDGTGKLLTDTADNGEVLLPYNTMGLENAQPHGSDPADFFVAGDIRANENTLLTAIHTLFMREHNRLCDIIVVDRPEWDGQDELIYQHARSMVIAQMQQITFNEFLPALLSNVIPPYSGYSSLVNAGINTEFSTAGYRLGHSMIPSQIQIGDDPMNNVLVRDAFFQPAYLQANGADDLILGAAKRIMNQIDGKIIDDLRDFLFGPPTATNLLDLASINIQRGRDHGLNGYNATRVAYGLSSAVNFSNFEPSQQAALQTLYGTPDNIDPWVGGLTEQHAPGAAVGPLVQIILLEQFTRLRDGDRFWFEVDPALTSDEITLIKNTRLSDVILRNTSISSSDLNVDVFHV